jgi:hypothetical protein
LTPFVRLDPFDSVRNRFDLREAELDYTNGPWRVDAGMRKVSWSVTEAVNVVPFQVVDIVNQRDFAGDPSGQEKLGAAMAVASYQGSDVLVQGYYLPWFRPREFPSMEARENPVRGQLDLNGLDEYVSGDKQYEPGAAVRVEAVVGPSNIAFIQFRGYAPQPLLFPMPGSSSVRKLYYLIDMSGLTLQATVGKWTVKTETAYFDTSRNPDGLGVPDNYVSSDSGVEYTFVGNDASSDLSAFAEWMYDSRGDSINSPFFPNDVFLGARWVANDLYDTQVLGGVIRQLDARAAVFHLQYQRRIKDQWQLQVVLRHFSAEPTNPIYAFSHDSLFNVRLKYFF